MTLYERVTVSLDGGVCDVAGRIVEVLDAPRAGRKQITALVERPSGWSPTTAAAAAGSADPASVDEEVHYCIGTKADDSRCSREVDGPGERCFQHPEDDE